MVFWKMLGGIGIEEIDKHVRWMLHLRLMIMHNLSRSAIAVSDLFSN